jgi:hypothetical protein
MTPGLANQWPRCVISDTPSPGDGAGNRVTGDTLEAAKAKLGEQRKFILWWDDPERAKRAGARDGKRRGTGDTPLLEAKDLGLGTAVAARSLLKRWRAAVGGSEQAQYICWRDSVVKVGGDRKSGLQNCNFDLPPFDPGKTTASRLRKALTVKVDGRTIIDEGKFGRLICGKRLVGLREVAA